MQLNINDITINRFGDRHFHFICRCSVSIGCDTRYIMPCKYHVDEFPLTRIWQHVPCKEEKE